MAPKVFKRPVKRSVAMKSPRGRPIGDVVINRGYQHNVFLPRLPLLYGWSPRFRHYTLHKHTSADFIVSCNAIWDEIRGPTPATEGRWGIAVRGRGPTMGTEGGIRRANSGDWGRPWARSGRGEAGVGGAAADFGERGGHQTR